MRFKTLHQLDRPDGYYRAQKGKGKRKRTSPWLVELEGEVTQAPPQEGEENVQGPEKVEDTRTQDDPQVLPSTQAQGEKETEVQEVSPPQKKVCKPPLLYLRK